MKNINKGVYSIVVAGALLFFAIFVYAETSGLSGSAQDVKTNSQQVNQQIKQLREETEKTKQIRVNLKQKISQIKDKKKQDTANRIVNQIDHINQVWTKHFILVLDKLDTALQRIKSRAQKASANGQDASATNTAIQKAETSIAAARSAVLNQAQKVYNVNVSTITDETKTTSGQSNLVSTFKTRFKLLRDQVFKDLFSLRDGLMKDARISVKDALRTLSKVPDVDKEPTANSNQK